MKYNLKNRPLLMHDLEAFEDWVNGLKKELQSRNAEIMVKEIRPKTVGDMESQYWRGYIQRGKEMLGE